MPQRSEGMGKGARVAFVVRCVWEGVGRENEASSNTSHVVQGKIMIDFNHKRL